MTLQKISTIFCLLCILTSAYTAVEYCATTETIRVTDYPADWPCTPRLLARIDQTFGWGRVSVNETTDTVTVAANLIIGQNDRRPTWFQIGNPVNTGEVLVVQGEMRVHSTWLADENLGLRHRLAGLSGNRLTLGIPGNTNVNARLLLEKHTRGAHRLVIGGFSGWATNNYGGELHVYNSEISSLNNVPMQHWQAGCNTDFVFSNSVIRDVGGRMAVHLGRGVFEYTRFENCGEALYGLSQDTVRGCVFNSCRMAIRGPSRNPLVLYDCIFKNNKKNWHLEWQPLIAIDCEIDNLNKGYCNYNSDGDVFVVSKRHIIVKVTDANRQPVKHARVRAVTGNAATGAPEYDVVFAVTDVHGSTPGRDMPGALLLNECLVRAKEGAETAPLHTAYVYTLEAADEKRTASLRDYTVRHSWEEITLVLTEPIIE